MKNRLVASLLLPLSLVILAGCQSMPEVNSEFNPEVDFSDYKTYGLMPIPTDIPGANNASVVKGVGMIAQAAVTKDLNAKGYQKVSLQKADFAVNLSGSVVPKADTIDMGYTAVTYASWYGYYTPYAYDRGTSIDLYEEGNLMIEIFDSKTKELVWVGWAQARRDSDLPDPDRIRKAVSEILRRFPPEK